MLRKSICLFVLIFLTVPLLAEKPGAIPVDKKVGYALLDALGQAFRQMAATGSGGAEKMTRAVERFMIDAKKAKGENQIDAVFFARYGRILAIIKLVVAPDPSGILGHMIDQELSSFVYDVLGEDWKGSGPGAINQVANSIADEIISLHLYLDNAETKDKLRKAWDKTMPGPATKKEE
jgi:hypothetical protein